MKEVSWDSVKKKEKTVATAAIVAKACIGKSVKDATNLLEMNKVKYVIDNGDLRSMDVVENRVVLEVSKGVVKTTCLG